MILARSFATTATTRTVLLSISETRREREITLLLWLTAVDDISISSTEKSSH